MKKPFLSIVIPTRKRDETLSYAIQTILQQDFDDCEVVVFDNCSSKKTKDVIEKLNSPLIKYFRSDMDLQLCDSWNEAILKANGEYVTVMADNDGFIDGSLHFIKKVIEFYKYPVLVDFVKNSYNWPSSNFINQDKLYLHQNIGCQYMNGEDVIREALKSEPGFAKLPMIYKALVHHSLIEKMKRVGKGRVINALAPDVYTGFFLAYTQKRYIQIQTPTRIAGNSSKSIGLNFLSGNLKKSFKMSFGGLKSYSLHRNCIFLPQGSNMNAIFDGFLAVKDLLNIKNIDLTKERIVHNTVLTFLTYDENEFSDSVELIKQYCDGDKELLEVLRLALEERNPKININFFHESKIGFGSEKLILDGKKFKIKNILQVSKFMANFYDYSSIEYPKVILSELKSNTKIAIWGTGEYGMSLYKHLQAKDLQISYFIDSFIENLEVTPPIKKPKDISNDIDCIIIASMYFQEISDSIRKMKNCENIDIFQYKIS